MEDSFPPVLVCFAVREEAGPFTRRERGDAGVRTLLTGVGHDSAERRVRAVLEQGRPTLALSCGLAGGLNPAHRRNTVLFEAGDHSRLADILRSAGAIAGRFHCSPRVVITASEKRQLWHQTRADAVEMESAVIRRLCDERGIPSATIRVISDAADEDLPIDFNALFANGRLRIGRLAAQLLRSPVTLRKLLQLRRQCAEAAGRLAEVLHQTLETMGSGPYF